MLFCAYCGKSFTRKEHLERHIPSHTNVKPHRCGSCQLSFSRRDLLQRHHSTYHEVRDPTQPLAPAIPTLAGRTPIACMNCASAKTGCDKTVPCSRCAEKNLPCAARFARRASKILRRIATTQDQAVPQQDTKQLGSVNTTPAVAASNQLCKNVGTSVDKTQLDNCSMDTASLQERRPSIPDPFNPNTNFMSFNTDFIDPDLQYTDFMTWNDCSVDPNLYNADLVAPDFSGMNFSEPGDPSSGSEAGSGSSYPYVPITHTRDTSIGSFQGVQSPRVSETAFATVLQQALLASEEAWPIAKCHKPMFSGTCPRTALLHLEYLEQSSKNEDSWKALEGISNLNPNVTPLKNRTRDRILAIAQGVLHKALSIHRGGTKDRRDSVPPNPPFLPDINFFVLPPPEALETLLRYYMHGISLEASSVPGGVLDTNELTLRNQASTLLVLLMIAQGASRAGTEESRGLAAGLTEICRISLFDTIEKDIELSADPTVLHCALLFADLGAWGGDKWHMDIVMGQRGMYLAMLKNSGALEPQAISFPEVLTLQPELLWRSWLQLEGMNRLVYNWVATDFELSLFHDTAPILQISDLQARLPNSDEIWLAKSAEDWTSAVRKSYPCSNGAMKMHQLPPSLFELFSDFVQNNIPENQPLSMLQLRLLLHPLQSMVQQIRQTLSCFSEDLRAVRRNVHTVTKSSTVGRLEEVQALLGNWYDLHRANSENHGITPFGQSTLILYHILSLTTITSLSELERLARKDSFDGSYWDLSLRHKRCIQNSTEAIFHSGQVLRITKASNPADRSPWWPVAVYRASIVLWVDCLAKADPSFPQQKNQGSLVAVDDVVPEDPSICNWRWHGEGTPVLLRSDTEVTKMGNPSDVLSHCISVLKDGGSARMLGGINRKLMKLHSNWHAQEGN